MNNKTKSTKQNTVVDLLKVEANTPMEKAEQLIHLEAIERGIREKITRYKADLLKVTQDLDVLQLKTGKYTISRCKRITPRVADFEALKASLDKAQIPYGTKEVFADYMGPVFKQAIETGRELDGLEGTETEYVMVRLPKKKEEK